RMRTIGRNMTPVLQTRRDFVRTLSLAAAATAVSSLPAAAQRQPGRIKLGIDNFAVRALNLKGRDLIDYAASLHVDTLFITDLPALGSLDEAHAAELRKYAADRGVELLL